MGATSRSSCSSRRVDVVSGSGGVALPLGARSRWFFVEKLQSNRGTMRVGPVGTRSYASPAFKRVPDTRFAADFASHRALLARCVGSMEASVSDSDLSQSDSEQRPDYELSADEQAQLEALDESLTSSRARSAGRT